MIHGVDPRTGKRPEPGLAPAASADEVPVLGDDPARRAVRDGDRWSLPRPVNGVRAQA